MIKPNYCRCHGIYQVLLQAEDCCSAVCLLQASQLFSTHRLSLSSYTTPAKSHMVSEKQKNVENGILKCQEIMLTNNITIRKVLSAVARL